MAQARSDQPSRSLRTVLASVLLGTLCGLGLGAAGLVHYEGAELPHPFPPSWVFALWALLAMAFDRSLRWLVSRPLLAGLLGFVAGPLSDLSGQRLGVLEISEQPSTLPILACTWACVLVALSLLARRKEPSRRVPTPRVPGGACQAAT